MKNQKTTVRLNTKFVQAAKAPSRGRSVFRDDKSDGFQLHVTTAGAKSFYFRFADKRKFLGRFPEVSAAEARDLADDLRGKVARGNNPFADSPGRHGGPTLAEFFETWKTNYAMVHRPGTVGHDAQLFKKHIKDDLGTYRIVNITTARVQKLHATIKVNAGKRTTGPAGVGAGNRTANSALQLLSCMFNCASQWGLYHGPNPTIGIKRFKESKRERYLKLNEVPAFFTALNHKKTPQDARDLILLALFTGARRGNLFSMAWKDIDFGAALWVIPENETKTGKAYRVPLVGPALAILNQRHLTAVRGVNFVFPANSKSGHMVHFQKQWNGFRKRAGLSDLRFHDLRHSLASWLVQGNTSLAIVGKVLGHNSVNTTQRYSHLNDGPVRGAMTGAVNALLEAGGLLQVKEGK